MLRYEVWVQEHVAVEKENNVTFSEINAHVSDDGWPHPALSTEKASG
jgi:hypothetical protein